MFPRFRPKCLVLALAALPGLGHALGLGPLHGDALIGEPLRVEIQLIGAAGAQLKRECIALQQPEQASGEGSFPRNLNAQIETRSTGQVISVTTATSINLPVLEFRVALLCGFNIARDYTVLPLFRKVDAKTGAAPAEPVAASPARIGVSTAVTATRPGSVQRAPDGAQTAIYGVTRDMTVAELADEYFRNQPMRRVRFKRWVLEANPDLSTESRLSKGQEITVPAGIPPRRPGERQDPVTGEFLARAEPTSAVQAFPPEMLGKTEVPPAKNQRKNADGPRPAPRDQLRIGGENTAASFRNMKDVAQVVDRLNTLLEQQLLANLSLELRIRELETQVGEFQQRLTGIEANMAAANARNAAALQAALDTARKARTVQENHNQWLIALLVAVAAVTLTVVLLRRKPAPLPQFISPPNDTPSATSEAVTLPVPRLERVSVSDAAEHITRMPEKSAVDFAATIKVPVKKARSSLDFREESALAPVPTAVAQPEEQDVQPTTPASGLDFELEFEPPLGTDPLNFTLELPESTPAPLPSRFESQGTIPPTLGEAAPDSDAQDSSADIIELASIMASMGLTESAAEILATHIAAHPHQSLQHWLKLLEVYRLRGSHDAFDKTAEEMRTHFNVHASDWEPGSGAPQRTSLEDFPHLMRNIQSTWREAGCVQYMHSLLTGNRLGTRAGFSQSIAEELLLLIAIVSEDSGANAC